MKIEHIASRYRIIREIGRGGMGVVYLVEHAHTGEKLALKLLHGRAASDPEVVSRFKREARAAAQIRSEHVVRVTDADVADELGGAPFFAMELLEGLDLEKLVSRVGRLHSSVVVSILSQIGRALDKAHAVGIVHRDLKPENLFLHRREDGSSIAKILDFGISKFLASEDARKSSLKVTADGMLMGTPHYMAPEQARGLVDAIGPATDMWAVGLIAVWLLTGAIYWTAPTHAELMVELLVSPMPQPSSRWPQLDARFDAWFARSCDRDPSQRWGSVTQQIAALAEALSPVPNANQPDAGGASMETVASALRQGATAAGQPAAGPVRSSHLFPTPGGATMSVVMPSDAFGSIPNGNTAAAGTLTRTTSGQGRARSSRRVLIGFALLTLTGLGLGFGYRSLFPAAASLPSASTEPARALELPAKAPEQTLEAPANAADAGPPQVNEPPPVDDYEPLVRRTLPPTPMPVVPTKRLPPQKARGRGPAGPQSGSHEDPLAP